MLHGDCQDKIRNLCHGESVRDNFLDLFNAVCNDTEAQDLPSGTLVYRLYDDDSKLQPGDWAAELHFIVRQVESVDDSNP